MKQVVIQKGKPIVVEIKSPNIQPGMILIQIYASCISPGTEIKMINQSRASLLQKSKRHPDKIVNALSRMKNEGISSVIKKTLENQYLETEVGYSAAGKIIDVGPNVNGYQKGMHVAVAGTGYANHAEFNIAPVNLTMPVPNNVSFNEASTCALGGIALQGIRRAETSIGEIIAVLGCGAIGLITIQLLKASGCGVVAIDLDSRRLKIAKNLGADKVLNAEEENIIGKVFHYTNGYGVDKAIITASSESDTILSQAFGMCRQKGRVVLVGVIGQKYNRTEMYSKELDFVISTSYGPGRYDEQYERFGKDYPYGYVRWTEKRNMEAYLKLIADGNVNLKQIIESSFDINDASHAYKKIKEENLLLATLNYSKNTITNSEEVPQHDHKNFNHWLKPENSLIRLGIIGTGNFIRNVHLPNLKKLTNYKIKGCFNRTGLKSYQIAKYFAECKTTSNYEDLLNCGIDMVMIGTRHDTHAELAIRALESGKAVFVEKPMCISLHEYQELCEVVKNTKATYMVGYNRRFSPFAGMIKNTIQNRVNPLMFQYTMNAGYVQYSSWIHTKEGGGRIIGEVCHIIDLLRFLIGYKAVTVYVEGITPKTGSIRPDDNITISMKYEDGSVGTILYSSLGSTKFEKESLKIFCDGEVFEMNDYKTLKYSGRMKNQKLKTRDKGHLQELKVFAEYVLNGKQFPIPFDELQETWLITRQIADSLH